MTDTERLAWLIFVGVLLLAAFITNADGRDSTGA